MKLSKTNLVNYVLAILVIIGIAMIARMGYLKMVGDIIANKILSQGEAVQFEFAIGGVGSEAENSLSEPLGVAIAENGDFYVADTLNSVIKIYSSQGKFKSSFGGKELLYLPSDIAVDGQNVYVVDEKNFRIQLFDLEGKFKRTFVGGEIGKKIGAWIPSAMCIGPKGEVYVTDVFYHRVIVFDQKGQIITHFGTPGTGPGQLSYPNGIAVDQLGNVFVADSNNGRIQVFDAQGKFINSLSKVSTQASEAEQANESTMSKETTNGQGAKEAIEPLAITMPRGIAFGAKGKLYVAETFAHRLLTMTVNRDLADNITMVGSRGSGDGEMNFPNDVTIRGNTLAVADRANNRILVYNLNE